MTSHQDTPSDNSFESAPENERAKLEYVFPIPQTREDWTTIGRRIAKIEPEVSEENLTQIGPFIAETAHDGPERWAVDFLVPDGTPVVAGRRGRVVNIKEDSDKYGPDQSHADLANWVVLQHENGEFTQYAHLAQSSVTESGVKNGDVVETGQVIGVVGKSGKTDRDHLHFMTFRTVDGPEGFGSLQVGQFKE